MEQIELSVTSREILGKKVRFLRRQGITPAHLFGHGIESVALQCDTARLRRVLAEAGRTSLISLKLDNERESRNAVVREVQTEPLTGELIHVDFYQVEMAKKVKVEVPIVLAGEAPALKAKENMLAQELGTLTVECLPGKIPASAELDISTITEPEQVIRVKDIELDEEITVLNDPELVVVRIRSGLVEKPMEERMGKPAVAEAAPLGEEKSKE